ncbi:hypothetical protein ABW636_12815 [Aquimarina sp. 2201CG1-2-11]|uniref:hypothetical protein n=1 Tax=Aquimarina discodermiae TaxID=3231043 RepID=UPI003462582F
MKNRLIVFMSTLMATTLLLSCSNDDDSSKQTDTSSSEVVAEGKYQDVKSATGEINAVVKKAISNSLNTGRSAKNISNDCVTVIKEITDTKTKVTIDYGDGCKSPDGKPISGKIMLSYTTKNGSEGNKNLDITYTLENFSFNDITVSGSSTATSTLRSFDEIIKFDTDSSYVFTWDDGLEATSTNKVSAEQVIDETIIIDFNTILYYYANSVTINSKTNFSTGDVLTSKTTTPLRIPDRCKFAVSGGIETFENGTLSKHLDYGNGTCDTIAIVKDKEGNETTIDLEVEVAENYKF